MSDRRIPPNDIHAEQAVIGSLMMENSVMDDVVGLISADDFYHSGNKNIYMAIVQLIDTGKTADIITVCEHMTANGTLTKSGGHTYVAEVVDVVVSPSSAKSYAQIVKEKSVERRIISESSRIIESVFSTADGAHEKLDSAQKTILELSLSRNQQSLRSAKDVAKATFAEIEERHKRGGDNVVGISTGLCDLDAVISGMNPGDLIIIAARPGMGKTALAVNIAVKVVSENVPAVIFSLEMPGTSLMNRIFAGKTGIDSKQIKRGMIFGDQWPKLVSAAGKIANEQLFIDDQPDITVQEIRAKCRKLKKDGGLGLVVVDYIQLMKVAGGKHDNREQQVAEISRTLKLIAREMECPVIGLSQLNRQVENRADRRPMMADLRESGAIEQDADMIFFIYRDEVYNKSEDNPEKGIAEIDVAKHRNGATGRIKTVFDAKTQTFRNMERQYGRN